MKRLLAAAISLMLLVGCAGSADAIDKSATVADDVIADADNAEHRNFELIWDTTEISGLIPASLVSDLGTEMGIYTDFTDYYLITESGPVKLERNVHTASYGRYNVLQDILRLDDKMIHAQGSIISGHEYIIDISSADDMTQLFLADTKTDTLTPLLPDSAFGFSYDEYYALTNKWETIFRCGSFDVNPSGNKIVYFSNKGTDGENPIFEYGIWIYDLESCKEYKLDTSMCEGDVSSPMWVSDDKVLFEYADEDGYPVYCVYDLSENLPYSEFSSLAINTAVDQSVMVYSLSDFVEIIEFDSGKLHGFKVGKLLSFYAPEMVSADKTVAFADRDNDVYVFNLETDAFNVYPTEFSSSKVSVGAILENGDVIVNVWSEDLTQIEGIYKIIG